FRHYTRLDYVLPVPWLTQGWFHSPRPRCLSILSDCSTSHFYALSLHDALPILSNWLVPQAHRMLVRSAYSCPRPHCSIPDRKASSEAHTSELHSHLNLLSAPCHGRMRQPRSAQRWWSR